MLWERLHRKTDVILFVEQDLIFFPVFFLEHINRDDCLCCQGAKQTKSMLQLVETT